MKFIYSLLFLFIATIAFADSPKVVVVDKPAVDKWQEVKAEKGRMLTLSAEPASKWLLVDDNNVDFRSTDNGKFGDFVSSIDGTFKLLVTSPTGETTKVAIIVGTAPIPPPPIDPLKAKLQDAFIKATDSNKVELAKDLALLYSKLAILSQDTSYVKASDLLTKAKDVSTALIGPTALVDVRNVVRDELNKIFPVDGDLTKAQRDASTALFNKLSTFLSDIANEK